MRPGVQKRPGFCNPIWMAATSIARIIDVFKDRHLNLRPGFPWSVPDHLGRDGLGEDCNHGVAKAFSLPPMDTLSSGSRTTVLRSRKKLASAAHRHTVFADP